MPDLSPPWSPGRVPLAGGLRGGRLAALWVVLVLTAGSLILCLVRGTGEQGAEFRAPLVYLARVFIVPVELSTASDLRYRVLMVALAGALLGAAVCRSVSGAADAPRAVGPMPRSASRLFVLTASAMLAVACASALWHASWELSRGWLLMVFCGCGWAAWLSQRDAARLIRPVLAGAGLVALVALASSLFHRSVLEFRYFRWPIGALTTTAVMAALWAAMAGVWTIHRALTRRADGRRGDQPAALLAGFALVGLALAVAVLAGRRGALLGGGVALAFGIGLAALRRVDARRALIGLVVVTLVAALGVAAWVRQQSASSQREVSGPLTVRYAYWGVMADSWREWWLAGVGPDLFVVRVTNAIARQRAEMPHVLHGGLERSAHNEWFQAVYELGALGGLLYLALPLIALVAVVRAYRREPDAARRADLATVAAGIVAVLVIECSSVNLRYPTLQVWYWTLLGLALAAARGGAAPDRDVPFIWRLRGSVRRLGAAGVAVSLLLLVANDLQSARAAGYGSTLLNRDDRQAAILLEAGAQRLGAESVLKAWFDLGVARSNVARGLKGASATQPATSPAGTAEYAAAADAALQTWSRLYSTCRGYPDAGGRFCDALINANRPDDARRELAAFLRDVNPYDAPANILYAAMFTSDPLEKLLAAERAMRSGGIDLIEGRVERWTADPTALAIWQRRVAEAEADLRDRPEPDWRNRLAPEALRVEACRLAGTGDLAGAARLQAAAARAYGRLYAENNPRRRMHLAEIDAFRYSAEFVFRADPARWAEAFDLICEAERFAVLSIEHEYLRRPDPNRVFVGGTVIPGELPDRFRPMWGLSAALFLTARASEADLRLRSALPADVRWQNPPAQAYRRQVAKNLVDVFAGLPAEQRPPSFARLRQLAGLDQPVDATFQPAN